MDPAFLAHRCVRSTMSQLPRFSSRYLESPSDPNRILTRSLGRRKQNQSTINSRSFTSSATSYQEQSPDTTARPELSQPLSSTPQQRQQQTSLSSGNTQYTQQRPTSAITSSRLRQNLFGRLPRYNSAGQPADRPTASNPTPPAAPTNSSDSYKYPGRDPLDSFLVNPRTQGNRPSVSRPPPLAAEGPSPTPATPQQGTRKPDIYGIIDDLVDQSPQRRRTPRELSQDLADSIDALRVPQDETPVYFRLKPSLGRTMAVDNSRMIDVTAAFRILERECARNNVKVDERRQRIHVRRGQRRKEERSRRWKNLFKKGFINEVGRVRRMQKQGW